MALPLSPFSVLVPSGTLPGAARLPPHPASLFDVWCLGFGVTCLVCLVGCALVWFGGDVLAVPVPVTSHPPPLSVAVVQIEVNGASSLSPSLPLVCSSNRLQRLANGARARTAAREPKAELEPEPTQPLVVECCICFSDERAQDVLQCASTHALCAECVVRYAEVEMSASELGKNFGLLRCPVPEPLQRRSWL